MREKISRLTLELENQKIAPLWSIANENVVFSAAINQRHQWKNKSKKLSFLMHWSSKLKISDLMVFLIGLYSVSNKYWIAIRQRSDKAHKNICYNRIFVGHGANAEKFIFQNLIDEYDDTVLKINVITLDNINKSGGFSFCRLLILLVKNSFGLSKKIKKLSDNLQLCLVDFLSVAALNIGEYVFFREFFRVAKKSGVGEVVFLALHVASHACFDEKIKIVYLSHGLIKLSILMVNPDAVLVLTEDERKYLRYRFNKNVICELMEKPKKVEGTLQNSVVIVSPEILNNFPKKTQENFYEFLMWADAINFTVIFRPSPRISQFECDQLKAKFSNASLDDTTIDFSDRLSVIKPKLIAGFNSTCFVTSLDFGVLPISFCDPVHDASIFNMIYPMGRRALFWPRDKSKIEAVLDSTTEYQQLLSLLSSTPDHEIVLN